MKRLIVHSHRNVISAVGCLIHGTTNLGRRFLFIEAMRSGPTIGALAEDAVVAHKSGGGLGKATINIH
jgi:hypothetical protein